MIAASPSRTSSPESLSSFSLSNFFSARVFVHHRGERRAESLLVGAALVGVDGVGEGMHRFVVGGVPLHRDLHLHRFALGLETDDRRVDRVLGVVEVLDVIDQTARVVEGALQRLPGLGDLGRAGDRLGGRPDLGQVRQVAGAPLVAQHDGQALVQERHLLQPAGHRLDVVLGGLEDPAVGPEGDRGAGSRAGAELVQRPGLGVGVGLLVSPAVAVDLHVEPGGQRVDHRDADAVQAAGDGVGVGVELAAGVQDRHDAPRRWAASPSGASRPGCRGRCRRPSPRRRPAASR